MAKNPEDIKVAKDLGFSLVTDSDYAHVDDFIPTFFPQIDKIMGGGIPLQRITEVFSPEQVGKSTFMIELTKACSQLGVKTFYIDGEGTADRVRFEELGVDPSNTFVASPAKNEDMTIEYAAKRLETVIDSFTGSQEPLVIIMDSIGGIPAQGELELDPEDEGRRGMKANAVTRMVTKLNTKVKRANVAVVLINQVRANQNMKGKYDNPIVRPGGKALEFADSLRLELKKGTTYWKGTGSDREYEGHILRVVIDKSKVSRPHQKRETSIFAGALRTTTTLTNKKYAEKDPNFIPDLDSQPEDPIVFKLDGIDYEYNLFQEGLAQGILSKVHKGYITMIDPQTGEELYEERENDFIFLLKQNYNGIRKQLFEYVLIANFPENFPPLDNKNVKVTSWPDMKDIQKIYKQRNKEKQEREKKREKEIKEAKADASSK